MNMISIFITEIILTLLQRWGNRPTEFDMLKFPPEESKWLYQNIFFRKKNKKKMWRSRHQNIHIEWKGGKVGVPGEKSGPSLAHKKLKVRRGSRKPPYTLVCIPSRTKRCVIPPFMKRKLIRPLRKNDIINSSDQILPNSFLVEA